MLPKGGGPDDKKDKKDKKKGAKVCSRASPRPSGLS